MLIHHLSSSLVCRLLGFLFLSRRHRIVAIKYHFVLLLCCLFVQVTMPDCSSCCRSFKRQEDLDRHIQHSSAHQKPNDPPGKSLSATAPSFYSPYTENPYTKNPTLKAGVHNPMTGPSETRRGGSLNASASNFYPPNTAITSPWSVILGPEYPMVLNALSTHCHSLEVLRENNYIVDPFDPEIYANSRKCKRCKSKSDFLSCLASCPFRGQ